jgi:hypothetical protein
LLIAAESISKLNEQYHSSKMNYLKAVMQNDEQLKINELKNIIAIGEKLKKDVRPDKKSLKF